MKDKIKRKRILFEKNIKNKINDNDININPNDDYESLKLRQEYEEKSNDRREIIILEKKIKLVKIKTKELNNEFKTQKRNEFNNYKEFKDKYQKIKAERKKVIKDLEIKLKDLKKKYKNKWETGDYKIKRWSLGMGKEFSRITWATKKSVWLSFVIVIVIVLVLAVVFLGIDRLFSL